MAVVMDERLTLDVVVVLVVDFFDASIAKREFSHPVNSSSDGRWNTQSWLTRLAKAVVLEVVSTQVLSRVVGGDVVHVHLITILGLGVRHETRRWAESYVEVVVEEVAVTQIVDHGLHAFAQILHQQLVLE